MIRQKYFVNGAWKTVSMKFLPKMQEKLKMVVGRFPECGRWLNWSVSNFLNSQNHA